MGWKDTQSRKIRKKNTKLAIILIGAILLLFILGGLLRFTHTLFSPWKAPFGKDYLWDTTFNLNLLVKTTSQTGVISYNPQERQVKVLTLPDNLYLEVPFGFGFWQLRAVYDLGKAEKIGGERLLQASLTSFLGIPIDGFIKLDAQEKLQVGDLVERLRQSPFSGWGLIFTSYSNLALWELISLKFELGGVRFDKVEYLDPLDFGVLDKVKLLDGTEVYTGDPLKFDAILVSLKDPILDSEHKSVAIFNATNYPGLAQKAKRQVVNLGGNVIITANAGQNIKESYVWGEKSRTLDRLTQIFDLGCSKNPKCEKINPQNLEGMSRAQVVLVVGEDFALGL